MKTVTATRQGRVLVVEDERDVAELIRYNLAREGYDVVVAPTGPDAIPVIMVTGRVEEGDKVLGFEMGADDYVTKPFSPRELLARIRAVSRRGRAADGQEKKAQLKAGDLEIERIGDQAVNIGQRTLELNREPQLKPYIDLPRMAERAQGMVKESLDAFVSGDTELTRKVCAADNEVDALKEQIFRELLTFMMEDAKTIPRAIRLILVSRFLERVADHATNIAEMVIYMIESKMVRHTLA